MNPWLDKLNDHREREGLPRLRVDEEPPVKGRGLGDTAERVIDTVTLGRGKRVAQALAKAMGKSDCGCAKRRDKLNRLVPYGGKT